MRKLELAGVIALVCIVWCVAVWLCFSPFRAQAQDTPGRLYIGKEYPGPAFICSKAGIEAVILADASGKPEDEELAVAAVKEGKCGIINQTWRIGKIAATYERADGHAVTIMSIEIKHPRTGEWVDVGAFAAYPGEVTDGDPA